MGKAIDDEVLLALAKKGGGGGGGTDDYEDLSHKPQVNGHTLEGNKTTSDLGIRFQDLPDAPTIPNDLADLQDDSTHRLVTDTEKATWNGKSDFSGAYDDLTGLPTLGTASSKDVPASGDAGNTEVVLGSDSRLTDSRPASDVPSWAKQSTKPTYTASEVGAIATTQKGVASGVAELDANGKVPSSQLPSYVDDVVEGYYDTITDRFYTESTFENVIPPESGKSWVDVASNKSYRWTGSVYSRVDEGVQLGETSGSAYRGDRGKVAYDHSQTTGNPHGTTKSDVGLGNVPNVSTNDQEPTFTEASTRNNIASGEKLSVIMGKVQKFFNDLKTVAFSGSFSDLSNKPSVNSVELSGNKTASDLGLQDELTFDNTPTDGSNNPVKSDGIYDSEKDIYAVMGKMGAKNLIPYPYYWENGHTYRGITFTYDSDGVIKANGTLSGTVSGFRINGETYADGLVLKAGNYILSGCPTGGASSTYRLVIRKIDSNNTATTVATDIGSGISFTISQEDAISYRYLLYCDILSGQTVSDLTFKPMLRLASDTDDTYQPYAKTNRELTESYPADKVMMSDGVTSVVDRLDNISIPADISTPDASLRITKVGNVIVANFDGVRNDSNGIVATVAADYCPSYQTIFLGLFMDDSNVLQTAFITLETTGEIKIYKIIPNASLGVAPNVRVYGTISWVIGK